jgi:two-component system CheB/CheR fusion protein
MVHVVDSDQAIADGLVTLLSTYGIEVLPYSDAEAFFRHWPANPSHNCCLIIDADIPGLSGPALLRELRMQRVDIPVLLLVGTSTPEMIEASRGAGRVGIIQKPCVDRTLTDRVLEIREAAAAEPGGSRGAGGCELRAACGKIP